MSTPVEESLRELSALNDGFDRSSDEEKTCVGDGSLKAGQKVTLDIADNLIYTDLPPPSPSQTREQLSRKEDDLELRRAEQEVSDAVNSQEKTNLSHLKSTGRNRQPRIEPADDFDIATNPIHQKTAVYQPPQHPTTNLAKLFKRVHSSSFLIRYLFYITPLVVLILVPLLLGSLLFKKATVGGVKLEWFCIWLEIFWLSLWAARVSPLHSCRNPLDPADMPHLDRREMSSLSIWTIVEPLHQQQQKMERHGQAARSPGYNLSLVARH